MFVDLELKLWLFRFHTQSRINPSSSENTRNADEVRRRNKLNNQSESLITINQSC